MLRQPVASVNKLSAQRELHTVYPPLSIPIKFKHFDLVVANHKEQLHRAFA